jgi:hypothetical protein
VNHPHKTKTTNTNIQHAIFHLFRLHAASIKKSMNTKKLFQNKTRRQTRRQTPQTNAAKSIRTTPKNKATKKVIL